MMKDLTILTIDTMYHDLTKIALEKSIQAVGTNKVVVISDQNILPGSKWIKIDPISIREYNRMVLKELHNFIDTEHFLIVQYDGIPTNPENWTDKFLEYDYIGAPWPWLPTDHNVGNGGFSLRSKKLLENLARPEIIFDPPQFRLPIPAEDDHICKFYKRHLESRGIKFAPTKVASMFSAENPAGKFNTFGFHGTLCLPYYLSDDHLEFYINNLSSDQYKKEVQIRIIYGLYLAKRYEHMELMMDKGVSLVANFKEIVLSQLVKDQVHFPYLPVQELTEVLINY